SFADIDENHRPAFAAVGHEFALLHDRVFGEMARMAFGRVAAPVDDEVGPVLDFAERTRDFTTQLGGDLCWTVSEGRVTVDHGADQLSQRNCLALRFAGDVAEP